MTVQEGLKQWQVLADVGKRPATVKYHREIVASLTKLLPNVPLESLTESDFTAFAVRAGHFSATRWNAFVGVLRPLTPAAARLQRRRVPFVERKPPNQAEFSRLLAECDRLPRSKAGLMIRFLAATGLRIGEARALTWADVHPDRIEVPARVTKNGRPRVIPIVNGLAGVLERLRALPWTLASSDATGSAVLPAQGFRRGLAKACGRAGVRQLSPHDFRRLFATRCIESGVDIPTAARWLGHQDGGALLAKRYFHLLDDHSRRMAERVQLW